MTTHDFEAGGVPGLEGRSITVDSEHFGIRFLVPILTIGLVIGMHLTGMNLLEQVAPEGLNTVCIMLPIDIVVFVGGGMLIERWLKRQLPSRRRASLSDEELVLDDRRFNPSHVAHIAWDKTVNVNAWRFTVHRRTRIPKGWQCLALHLLQDDEEIILYTFASPEESETLHGYPNFARLRPRKETRSNTDLRAVAEQRRLLKLEDARWADGAEISREDFKAVLAALEQNVPGWR